MISPIYAVKDLFSPVLSDRQIAKLVSKGQLIADSISDHQYQPNSVDLTLGDSITHLLPNCTIPWPDGDLRGFNFGGYSHHRDAIDTRLPTQHSVDHFVGDSYVLEPGEFVLMATREKLIIPNGILGFVCGRSSVARLAIQTEQAGLIDSGFTGTVTLEIFNQSQFPIVLKAGMRIAQIWFIRSKRSKLIYGSDRKSKYNGQVLATGSKLYLDVENTDRD